MSNYEHQKRILAKDPTKRGLFLGTGSGKTRLALQLAKGHTLVICPKTVRDKGHWEKEADKIGFDKERLTVISKEDLKKKWNKTFDSVQYFRRFDTIIGDEAHQLAGVQPSTYQKNYRKYPKTSQIFTNMLEMMRKTNPDRVYMLTATPTSQPMTVWGIATLLGYHWNYFQFRDTFYFEKSRNIFLKKKGPKYEDLLAQSVNHIGEVGRLQDWFDVPEQVHKEHWVEPTKGQIDAFPELQLLYPDPLVQLGKRHRLEQGLFEELILSENKTKAIEQYLDEFKKIVVYARYTAQIEHYAKHFSKKTKTLTLTGGTKDRKSVIEEAEKMKEGILVIQAQISEGYQLPSFPCMIFASEFSFTHRKQAEGRILRADHLKKNLYITLLCGAADERMRQAVATGQKFDDEVHAQNLANLNEFI